MQNYKTLFENLDGLDEISGYSLLKINLNQLEKMSKCDLSVADIRYVPMYEEYIILRRDGVPKDRIYQHFRKKYHISESTIKRVVKRLSKRVKL